MPSTLHQLLNAAANVEEAPIPRLATNLEELQAYVKSIGPRKAFQVGDVVVLTQYPYGLKNMNPGDRYVVVEDFLSPATELSGIVDAANVGDHVAARLAPQHPQGFVTVPINSRFFVLEKDFVPAPAPENDPTPTASPSDNPAHPLGSAQ